MLYVLPTLAAKSTSNVAAHHAHLTLGNPKHGVAQHVSYPVRILTIGVKRVALVALVVDAQRAARFHILRMDPSDDITPLDYARCARECRVRGELVSLLEDVRNIVRAFIPNRRGAQLGCLRCVRNRRERLVIDRNQL